MCMLHNKFAAEVLKLNISSCNYVPTYIYVYNIYIEMCVFVVWVKLKLGGKKKRLQISGRFCLVHKHVIAQVFVCAWPS